MSIVRVAQARLAVRNIVKDHGFVQEASLSTMLPEVRREVEEALLAKDKKIGSSVLTLAKNLYSSDARFIFELLQNAEDNKYEEAKELGVEPFVSFTIRPGKIIVECNEDGFTKENLQAICDVGSSSKSTFHGYIGEKGIGFKSVFMAAWKVHIQSKSYSFSFCHRKGESGMGMITPIWEDSDEELPEPLTRMTLYLHQDTLDESIDKQIRDMQDTILLFLAKIRRIEVKFQDSHGQHRSSITLRKRDADNPNRVILETSRMGLTKSSPENIHTQNTYHVTKHTVQNLPRSSNRQYIVGPDSSHNFSSSTVDLAFPLTSQSAPVVAPQFVFAFLPVRRMGFNFIMQADFDTDASRQDVKTSSSRNKALITGIAEAFIKAVSQFCRHGTLQYQWMRYLPREGSFPWDSFWGSLVSTIREKLSREPVLRSREQRTLRPIKAMRSRSDLDNDRYGNPLFPDLTPEIYISDKYQPSDLQILKEFGLRDISMDQVIATVNQDLSKGVSSKMRSADTEDDWHTRAAARLLTPFAQSQYMYTAEIKLLKLIPLQDGRWVAKTSGSIFFPTVDGVPIPQDLDMMLLSPAATKNPTRLKLFNSLGVERATKKRVHSSVLSKYDSSGPLSITLQSSKIHLQYLYRTHQAKDTSSLSRQIKIYDHLHCNMNYPADRDFYLPDDNPYGPKLLLGDGLGRKTDSWLIANEYLDHPPATPAGSSLTWTGWLHDCLGVRRHLRLASKDESSLSKECSYVLEKRNDQFLGFLKFLWPQNASTVLKNGKLLNLLERSPVGCKGGRELALFTTYLPLPDLEERCKALLGDRFFPFIILPERTIEGSSGIAEEWSFLVKHLGVGMSNGIHFRLEMLYRYRRELSLEPCIIQVADLYLTIDAALLDSVDKLEDKKRIMTIFEGSGTVFVPSERLWTDPAGCLWDAPSGLLSKHALLPEYTAALSNSNFNIGRLAQFFKGTLDIPDMAWNHIIDELILVKGKPQEYYNSRADSIRELYRRLNNASQATSPNGESIRAAFEEHSLVYVSQGSRSSWRKPSECLWSNTTRIEGRIAINDQYKEFRDFFVDTLHVKPVDLNMIHNELKSLSSKENVDIGEFKLLIKTFNSHLESADTAPTATELRRKRVFPVRYPDGQTKLVPAMDLNNAVIIDREGPYAEFKDLVNTLDFSHQEVCRLRPFIKWAKLEDRYISRCVVEESRTEGGRELPISSPERDVRMKSHGLLRIAACYNSPRFDTDPEELYRLLRSATTVETNGISSMLILDLGDEHHEVKVGDSELHIQDGDQGLQIYVPRDADDQDVCFKFNLPRGVANWLMTDPSGTVKRKGELNADLVNVIASILDCRRSAVLKILQSHGVPNIDIEDQAVEEAVVGAAERPRTPVVDDTAVMPTNLPLLTPQPQISFRADRRPSASDVGTPGSGWSAAAEADYATPFTDFEPDGLLRTSHRSTRSVPIFPSVSQYRELLEYVVSTARRSALPSFGSFDMTALRDSLPGVTGAPVTVRTYGSSDWEHRCMIGAAGELFVFELLRGLNPALQGFCYDNWQSTIRWHAQMHPDYADMPRWSGRETSDIVYSDEQGVLTAWLIERGYLNQTRWIGKKPHYYIEVKTTADQCATPFFVSSNQLERMKRTTNGPNQNRHQHEIYALFRVFHLGQGNMGVKIYVDPEEHRRSGRLQFSTDKWAVTPSTGLAGSREVSDED